MNRMYGAMLFSSSMTMLGMDPNVTLFRWFSMRSPSSHAFARSAMGKDVRDMTLSVSGDAKKTALLGVFILR